MTPRKPEEFELMREQSKRKIIDAALQVFGVNGYHNASIDKIAKEAGISKGLIYNYYKSKEELLEYVFMEGFKYFDEIIGTNGNTQYTPYEKLEQLMKRFIKSLRKNSQFWKLYQNVLSQPEVYKNIPKFKEYFETVFTPYLMGIFYEMYNDSMSEMEIQIEIMIFGAIMDGMGFDYVVVGDEYPLEVIGEKILLDYKEKLNKADKQGENI